MIPHIYVLTSVVENRILAESYGRFVVHQKQWHLKFFTSDLCKQTRHPHALTCGRCGCNELSFT